MFSVRVSTYTYFCEEVWKKWCIQKLEKTDPNFYKLILEENNLKSEEAIFIDDRVSYVEVAKSLGIKSMLFINSEKLKEDLGKLID